MSRYRVAAHVAWVDERGLDRDGVPTAYVARLPSGPPLVLAGPAWAVWRAVVDQGPGGGDGPAVAAATAVHVDQEPETVLADVLALLEQLSGLGVVEQLS